MGARPAATDTDDAGRRQPPGRRLGQLVRGAPLLGAFLAAGMLAAACGGPAASPGVANVGSSTTTTTDAPSGGSGQPSGSSGSYGQALAYSQCMRGHGVPDFPDPSSGGNFAIRAGPGSDLDPSSAAFRSADKSCSHLLPNGGKPTAAQQQKALAQALKFSRCMRNHGLANFPDPVATNGGIGLRIKAGSGINPSSPQFQAAQKACQGQLPGGGPKAVPAP